MKKIFRITLTNNYGFHHPHPLMYLTAIVGILAAIAIPNYFKYMEKEILPKIKSNRMRFWSAACSSGEEPYSIAISLIENLKGIESKDVLILATDISTRMLEKVKDAFYSEEHIRDLPKAFLHKYFIKVQKNSEAFYKVKDNVRSLVRVAWLNLMEFLV